MKILKESKENLPVAFLTSFVSDGWEKVGILKEEIEAIKKEFKGTKKVEELIQSLIDAYLVCIGQMEQHLAAKDYLDIDDKEEVKENLQEDVNINIEKVVINEPEVSDVEIEHENEDKDEIPAVNIPTEEIAIPESDSPKYAISDKEMDAFEKAIMAAKPLTDGAEDNFDIDDDDDDISAAKKLGKAKDTEQVTESCDWFCDFDAPVGEKLTDADLYPENN